MAGKEAVTNNGNIKKLERKVWIFQGNPLRYKVYESLRDESLMQDTWLVSHYRDEIHVGDIGLIWKARKASGIYAVGEIISNPQVMSELPESSKYWIDKFDRGKMALRVLIHYKLKLKLTNALFSEDLKKIPELRNLHIFKQSQGTNFKVESSQWEVISRLLKQKYNFEYI